MAAIMISSPATARSRPSIAYSHNAPKLTFHSLPKSPIFFPSVTFQPATRTKPRFLNVVVSAAKKLLETELVAVPSEPDANGGIIPGDSGVYAVYDGNGEVQLIDMSRDIAASVLDYKKSHPELCSAVKFDVVDGPDGMALQQSWESWMKEHLVATGKLPPVNEKEINTEFRQQAEKLSEIGQQSKKLSEMELVAVPWETKAINGLFPKFSGVYAVYDSNGELQFVGKSRDIASSVLYHKKSLPELCSSIKFDVVDEPDRTALSQSWKSWIIEHVAATGKLPPGNESGNTTWFTQQPKRLLKTKLVAVLSEPGAIRRKFPKDSGIYAVYDGNGELQFVGISRNIVASVLDHKKSLPELCSSVKFGAVGERDRTKLKKSWKSWMKEHVAATGKVPPGNEPGNNTTWSGNTKWWSGNTTWFMAQPKKLSETELVAVPSEPEAIIRTFPEDSGVYAVYDGKGELQFVSISRNICANVFYYKKSLPELCSSVKFRVVDKPDREALRVALKRAWYSWIQEYTKAAGKKPPGNEMGNTTWFIKKTDLKLKPGRNVKLAKRLKDSLDRLLKKKRNETGNNVILKALNDLVKGNNLDTPRNRKRS